MDNSENFFARDISANVLESLEPNAILFTSGDNDTFPLWYLQVCEEVRTDVTVLNVGLLNTPWYINQVKHREPEFPISMTEEEINELRIVKWTDTTFAWPINSTASRFGLPESTALPDTLRMHVPPGISDRYLLVADQVVLDMLQTNDWERPVYLSGWIGGWALSWLEPYLRNDGYAQRVMPIKSPPMNTRIMRQNLIERSIFRGYRDLGIPMSDVTRQMAINPCMGLFKLANIEQRAGNTAACRDVREYMINSLNPDRLRLPDQIRVAVLQLCEEPDAD